MTYMKPNKPNCHLLIQIGKKGVFNIRLLNLCYLHCVKSVQIWSFLWSVFSCLGIEYGDLRIKSPYSIRTQENTDQRKLRIWTLFTQCYAGYNERAEL